MRNVSRFRLWGHTLAVEFSIRREGKWPLWQVFLCCCSKWGAYSFSLSRLFCVLSQKEALVPSLPASPFLSRPFLFCMPYLVRLSLTSPSIGGQPWNLTLPLTSFLKGTTNSAISSRMLWTIIRLAKTSNKPISLATRMLVNPNL